MAQVDPFDDDLHRFVVYHYAYDPDRHERRHMVVAAYDNEREFFDRLATLRAELHHRRDTGEVDPREGYSGVVLERGHQRRQARGRTLIRALRHGIDTDSAAFQELTQDLPSNVGYFRAELLEEPGRAT